MKYFNKNNLIEVINFGKMPMANNFLKDTKKKIYTYNLKLGYNKKFKLAQIYDFPKPSNMFNDNYAFISSTSKYMKKHFQKLSQKIKKMKKNVSLLEIGSNDGVFLENFKEYRHLGVEPSKNVYELSKKKGLNVDNSFFDTKYVKKINNNYEKFNVVFGSNVICHIPNQEDLYLSVDKVLSNDGYFIFEEPYLLDMIKKTSYDQLYDEHIYIFSLCSVNLIAKKFGFYLFDAEKTSTHGGSMRYYLSKKKLNKTKRLKNYIKSEKKFKIDNISSLKKFAESCQKNKEKFFNKISDLAKKKETIYGFGATSKSTTILNFCKINKNHIKMIFDNSKTKINKFTPLTNIPIVNSKKFFKTKVNYCVLFAWNHHKEIFSKIKGSKNIRWLTHIDKKHFGNYKKYIL
jgi:methylation protein EvaC